MGTSEDELRKDAERQRERMGDTLEAIGDRLSPQQMVERRKAAVRGRWQQVKYSVMGSPSYKEPGTRDRVGSRVGGVAGSAGGAVQSATDQVRHAPEALVDQARGNPMAAGLIAFGAGALLATVMPTTRTEERIVEEAKPQLQHAADEVKSVGRDVAEDAKGHAQEAVEAVKSAGNDAKQNVTEQARSAAEQVRGQ